MTGRLQQQKSLSSQFWGPEVTSWRLQDPSPGCSPRLPAWHSHLHRVSPCPGAGGWGDPGGCSCPRGLRTARLRTGAAAWSPGVSHLPVQATPSTAGHPTTLAKMFHKSWGTGHSRSQEGGRPHHGTRALSSPEELGLHGAGHTCLGCWEEALRGHPVVTGAEHVQSPARAAPRPLARNHRGQDLGESRGLAVVGGSVRPSALVSPAGPHP